MDFPKPQPVKTAKNLRDRVDRMLRRPVRNTNNSHQLSLAFPLKEKSERNIDVPSQNIREFLDFVSDAMPDGDVYLFGGVLRDLALLGREGFNSDIDLVVEGDWNNLVPYLQTLGAHKNKFGGYRLMLGEWPVDIWNAKDTWAIKQGLVPFKGISSLVNTTVLNWDAILMNWRNREFICRTNYFEEINSRVLDIVLEENPNPLGMAIRVFRHFCLKDASRVTPSATRYMAKCAKDYSYEKMRNAELRSYKNTIIERPIHKYFENVDAERSKCIHHPSSIASYIVEQELGLLGKAYHL